MRKGKSARKQRGYNVPSQRDEKMGRSTQDSSKENPSSTCFSNKTSLKGPFPLFSCGWSLAFSCTCCSLSPFPPHPLTSALCHILHQSRWRYQLRAQAEKCRSTLGCRIPSRRSKEARAAEWDSQHPEPQRLPQGPFEKSPDHKRNRRKASTSTSGSALHGAHSTPTTQSRQRRTNDQRLSCPFVLLQQTL